MKVRTNLHFNHRWSWWTCFKVRFLSWKISSHEWNFYCQLEKRKDWSYLKVRDIDFLRLTLHLQHDATNLEVSCPMFLSIIRSHLFQRLVPFHDVLPMEFYSHSHYFASLDLFRTEFDSKSNGWGQIELLKENDYSMGRLLVRLFDSIESSFVVFWTLSKTTSDVISIEWGCSKDSDHVESHSYDDR